MKITSQHGSALLRGLTAAWVVLIYSAFADQVLAASEAPPGFVALFNGKDLTGWRGGETFDHRKYLEMPADKRAEQDAKWTADMKQHWRVENDELVNDGNGKYAATEKGYCDFELIPEFNTVDKAE